MQCEMFSGVIQLNRFRYACVSMCRRYIFDAHATYHMQSTSLGEKIVVEGLERDRGNRACSGLKNRRHKDSRTRFFTLFPMDGADSGGYGRMMACPEWPIALRVASIASAI